VDKRAPSDGASWTKVSWSGERARSFAAERVNEAPLAGLVKKAEISISSLPRASRRRVLAGGFIGVARVCRPRRASGEMTNRSSGASLSAPDESVGGTLRKESAVVSSKEEASCSQMQRADGFRANRGRRSRIENSIAGSSNEKSSPQFAPSMKVESVIRGSGEGG